MNSFLPNIDFWSAKAASLLDAPAVIWIMGKPSSGKTTLAKELESIITQRGFLCKLIDGDELRSGLNANLGFSEGERTENLRRAAEVAKLFAESHIVTIASFITPLESQRNLVKEILAGHVKLIMIGLQSSQAICMQRDVKGLYAQAKAGTISGLTGFDAPFDDYQSADIVLDTEENSIETCATLLLQFINEQLG